VLAPQRLNQLLPARASGINLTQPLLTACADKGIRVFLVGSPKGRDITQTATFLQQKYPGLRIAGTSSGYLDATGKEKLQSELARTKPQIILVGMGFPRQEQLMAKLRPHLGSGVMIGEGGSFDYRALGGSRPKAPRLLQQIGLEWFWRLLLEPWRLRRQLAIPRFIKLVWQWRSRVPRP
jgi:N-acetylglucosaminyldiphosphoundecaprenol N-acetyl-beta-D-mannosaminyltransferase